MYFSYVINNWLQILVDAAVGNMISIWNGT